MERRLLKDGSCVITTADGKELTFRKLPDGRVRKTACTGLVSREEFMQALTDAKEVLIPKPTLACRRTHLEYTCTPEPD